MTSPRSGVKPKLLIIDDEPDMLDFLERVLRRRFEISRTSNAEQALTWLQGGDFEVLVTDQKMPRMSGLELLERLGDQVPQLVKVLITGFTEMPAIQRAVGSGNIHAYVLKPVDGDSLLKAIADAYGVRDGRQPMTPPSE